MEGKFKFSTTESDRLVEKFIGFLRSFGDHQLSVGILAAVSSAVVSSRGDAESVEEMEDALLFHASALLVSACLGNPDKAHAAIDSLMGSVKLAGITKGDMESSAERIEPAGVNNDLN